MQVDRMKEKFIRTAVIYGDATLEGKACIVNKQNRLLNELYWLVRRNFALYESVVNQLLSHEHALIFESLHMHPMSYCYSIRARKVNSNLRLVSHNRFYELTIQRPRGSDFNGRIA